MSAFTAKCLRNHPKRETLKRSPPPETQLMGSKRPSGGGGSPRRLEGEKGPARDVPKTPGDAQRRITRAGAPVGWRRDTQPAAVLFWHQRAW